jgi:hypothetical protein
VYVDAAESSPFLETRTAKGWLARLPRGVGPLSGAGSESGIRGWDGTSGVAGISRQGFAHGLDGISLTSETPAIAAPHELHADFDFSGAPKRWFRESFVLGSRTGRSLRQFQLK